MYQDPDHTKPDESLSSVMFAARVLPTHTQIRLISGLTILVFLLIGAGSGIRAFVSYMADRSRPAVAQLEPGTFKPTPAQLANLGIVPVASMTFQTQQVTDGNIAIDDDVTTPVFSPYSGRVTKLIAKLGDTVEKGAPLMAIEASEFAQAQNDLVTAYAQLNLARTNETRQHELYDAKGAALRDWQQSQVDLATASAALNAVHNRLHILGISDKEISAAETAPVVKQTSSEGVILAPIAGTVIQRQVGLGQYIQSGASNPVYSIGNLSRVWLVANVREVDAPLMRVGQEVEVHVLAYPNRVFKAKISYVAPQVDPNIHRLPVRAEVENPDGALKPQMFATFSITTGNEVVAPAVLDSAIVYEGSSARVWVAHDDGSLGLRQIHVGDVSGRMVEIVDGLAPGEKIVSNGTVFIDRAANSD